MLIVIDQSIIEGFKNALETSLQIQELLLQKLEQLQKQDEIDKLLNIEQACEYLGGISPSTLLYYRKLGLDYYSKGKRGVWFRKGDIDEWLASGKVQRQQSK